MAASTKKSAAAKKAGELPLTVTGPADIGRLMKELEALDNQLLAHKVREQHQTPGELPKIGQMLGEIVDINGLDMLQQQDRERLRTFLETVKSRAPVMHMSFSTDPSPEFVAKLMAWLRQEIHPQLLLTVGLQPTIGAGCVVRTTNRYFDFTLRQSFAQKRDLLLSQLVRQPEEQSHGR